jgi:hypothetical protein
MQGGRAERTGPPETLAPAARFLQSTSSAGAGSRPPVALTPGSTPSSLGPTSLAGGARGKQGSAVPHDDHQGLGGPRGRGDEDNDHLTFDIAAPHDLWLHVGGGMTGSHVIVRNPGKGGREHLCHVDQG